MLKHALIAGCGGFIGTMVRYVLQQCAALYMQAPPYIATGCINIVGSFAIGGLYSRFSGGTNAAVLTFFAAGICGGFTTFSAFSLENIQLLRNGQPLLALTFTLVSVLAGAAFCWLGYLVVLKG